MRIFTIIQKNPFSPLNPQFGVISQKAQTTCRRREPIKWAESLFFLHFPNSPGRSKYFLFVNARVEAVISVLSRFSLSFSMKYSVHIFFDILRSSYHLICIVKLSWHFATKVGKNLFFFSYSILLLSSLPHTLFYFILKERKVLQENIDYGINNKWFPYG